MKKKKLKKYNILKFVYRRRFVFYFISFWSILLHLLMIFISILFIIILCRYLHRVQTHQIMCKLLCNYYIILLCVVYGLYVF